MFRTTVIMRAAALFSVRLPVVLPGTTVSFSAVLTAAAASITAAADARAAAAGALQAGPAAVAGDARYVSPMASGALQAAAPTLMGSADVLLRLAGTLAAGPASITASATARQAVAGMLTAGPASVSGSGDARVVAAGGLTAAAAVADGSASVRVTAAGALAAGPAVFNGDVGGIRLTGPLAAAPATVTATAAVGNAAAATLAAGPATIVGDALAVGGVTGALVAAPAAVSGTAIARQAATGALAAGPAVVAGDASGGAQIAGALSSGAAHIEATANIGASASGVLTAGAAIMAGAIPPSPSNFIAAATHYLGFGGSVKGPPAGSISGDLCIAIVSSFAGNPITASAPAGWTVVQTVAGDPGYMIAIRVLTGTDGGFDPDDADLTDNQILIFTYRGGSAISNINASSNDLSGALNSPGFSPSASAKTIASSYFGGATNASPGSVDEGGFTPRFSDAGADGGGGFTLGAIADASPADYDTTAIRWERNTPSVFYQRVISFEII